MKLLLSLISVWLVASCPSWASDQRFLELPSDSASITFDLDTVQIISPGRFAIMSTTIDNPDVMKFELKALFTLRDYCKRPDGKYPPPQDLFQFGQPDLPVEQIEVKTHAHDKEVYWTYPYERVVRRAGWLFCDSFGERHNIITNGERNKNVYDCKRGLSGWLDESQNASEAFMMPVKRWYSGVCRAVTHEEPYQPE
jgi:hypothetical protein